LVTHGVSALQGLLSVTDEEFRLFRDLIHKQTGISLKDGKRPLLASRLAKRLRDLDLETLTEYYTYLKRSDPQSEEMRRMVNCITTNKTSFFREDHHFHFLHNWLKQRTQDRVHSSARRLRIWSAACSSGEEPYSIAITILEALGRIGWNIEVLATDIDTDILARGESGLYDIDSLAEMDNALKRKYFLRGKGQMEGLVQVKPEVRRLVMFQCLNLVAEPWSVQGKFDAIFCRNVIIYFDRPTQEQLFNRLLGHLAPDGHLFVGHSESLYWMADRVTSVEHTVYRPRAPGTVR
jgi:chemotaxis protein methyltransferase CheR